MLILPQTQMAPLIKVGDRYYRALNGSEPDKYLLEKVELYKTDAIELVDVNK